MNAPSRWREQREDAIQSLLIFSHFPKKGLRIDYCHSRAPDKGYLILSVHAIVLQCNSNILPPWLSAGRIGGAVMELSSVDAGAGRDRTVF